MAEENTTAPQVDEVKVDETSINHPSAARRNSLEKLLSHRPERAELVEKNILPASNAAPGLQAQQKEVRPV